MHRPQTNEFDPYYKTYVSLISADDVLTLMDGQSAELNSIFAQMLDDRGSFAYAEGKWTIKELLSHLIDGERIFAYRVLRIARGDATPIEGFEQDSYIENSNANNRSFADLLEEFELERRANMRMIRNLSDEDLRRMGTASEKPVSARALVYIMAGHVLHHTNILRERYLV